MNNFVIKYAPGSGGEFFMCMLLACCKGMGPEYIKASPTNRYDGTVVGSKHQHFAEFLSYTGTLKDRPRYYKLLDRLRDVTHITLHGWTFNVIAHLRKNCNVTHALVIEDRVTEYSNCMAAHKVYSDLIRDLTDDVKGNAMYEVKRARERLREVSDNQAVLDYAKKTFECSVFDVHQLLNMPHEVLNMHAEKIAGTTITDEWYERLQEYREINYAIWEQYK